MDGEEEPPHDINSNDFDTKPNEPKTYEQLEEKEEIENIKKYVKIGYENEVPPSYEEKYYRIKSSEIDSEEDVVPKIDGMKYNKDMEIYVLEL